MEPKIINGQVSGRASPNFFSGQVMCNDGLHLVGNPIIKCRAGTWSETIPVCAGGWWVVGCVVIIMLTLSHWVLSFPTPGEEWEKYPHQRIKTVSCQV